MMNTATAVFTCFLSQRLPLRHPHGAGDVPFDQGDLACVREPLADVLRGVHDLDGAALAPPVAFLPGLVLDGDFPPVQGVQFLPQLLRVELDGEHVVRHRSSSQMSLAWALTAWPASAVTTCPATQ